MGKEIVLTVDGLKKLEDELFYLRGEKRQEVAERIKVALGFGDLSENSEYDEAKNEQALVESKITELEEKLRNAKVIDDDEINTKMVSVGTTVKVLDLEYNEEVQYSIVGITEVDLENNKISNESPIAQALIGRKKGETVEAEVPAGKLPLKILSISRIK